MPEDNLLARAALLPSPLPLRALSLAITCPCVTFSSDPNEVNKTARGTCTGPGWRCCRARAPEVGRVDFRAGWWHVSSGTALSCFRGFTLETEPDRGQLHSVFQGALALDCHLPVCRLAYGMTVNDDHCIRMLIQPKVQAVFIHSLT